MQETLTQRVYARLRRRLLSGSLAPGEQLVNRTLASELGTSAIPVREAISRLASEGLVDYIPGAGAFVRKPDRQELSQLYDLREALEPLAAAGACRFITDDELAELEALCKAWQGLVRRLPRQPGPEEMGRWLEFDERFHEILFRAARNPWLGRIAGELRLLARVFRPQRSEPAILTGRVAARTLRTHTELARALRRRNEREARKWMTVQIREGRKVVLGYFDEQRHGDGRPRGGKR